MILEIIAGYSYFCTQGTIITYIINVYILEIVNKYIQVYFISKRSTATSYCSANDVQAIIDIIAQEFLQNLE